MLCFISLVRFRNTEADKEDESTSDHHNLFFPAGQFGALSEQNTTAE